MKQFKVFFIGVILPLLAVLLTVNIWSSNADLKVWKEVNKHADEFVYDHTSDDGWISSFILYDKDSTYVCDILLDNRDKKTSVFNGHTCIASRFNTMYSNKVYKKLIKNIPENDICRAVDVRDKTLEHFKQIENSIQ